MNLIKRVERLEKQTGATLRLPLLFKRVVSGPSAGFHSATGIGMKLFREPSESDAAFEARAEREYASHARRANKCR